MWQWREALRTLCPPPPSRVHVYSLSYKTWRTDVSSHLRRQDVPDESLDAAVRQRQAGHCTDKKNINILLAQISVKWCLGSVFVFQGFGSSFFLYPGWNFSSYNWPVLRIRIRSDPDLLVGSGSCQKSSGSATLQLTNAYSEFFSFFMF